MSSIDYGSIVKKNGKVIQTEHYQDMMKSVGFEIEELKDNYFSYIGDEDMLVCVYKGVLTIYTHIPNIDKKDTIYNLYTHVRYNGKLKDDGYMDSIQIKEIGYGFMFDKIRRYKFSINNVDFDIRRIDNGHRYSLRFWYKGILYECLYGYGVDVYRDMWYGKSKKLNNFLNRWYGGV